MAHDMVAESALQFVAAAVEKLKLAVCVIIHLRLIGSSEVAEDGNRTDHTLAFQNVDHLGQIFFKESETVHACVELYMYRIVCDAIFLPLADYFVEYVETVDFRFQVICEEGTVVDHFWIKHHDRHCDSGPAKVNAFVKHGDSQIGRALRLQGFGQFIRAGSIARSLDHAYYAGGGAHH